MRTLLLGLSIVITLLLVSCGDNDAITSDGGDNPPSTENSVVETSEILQENQNNNEQNEQSSATNTTDTTDTTNEGDEINLPKVEF